MSEIIIITRIWRSNRGRNSLC